MKKLNKEQLSWTPDVKDNQTITKEVYCGICNELCEFNGEFNGPRGFIANMCRPKNRKNEDYPAYYSFTCPNIKEDWHQHAEKLYREQHNQPSFMIKNLLQSEINWTVREKRLDSSIDILDYPI